MVNHLNHVEIKKSTLYGWGKIDSHKSQIYYPKDINELKEIIKIPNKEFIVRGMGRSYGDSSINDNVISLKKMKKLIDFDKKNQLIYCSSNITYKELNKFLIKQKYFPIVTPGSQYVTIGGAVASDIHGKNHHIDGSFCEHIVNIDILNSDLNIIKCSKEENKEYFYATNGGMGLTGVILNVCFKVMKVKNDIIEEEIYKSYNLDETINLLNKKNKSKYVVAWLDSTASYKNVGRGIIYIGRHATDNNYKIKYSKYKFNINFNFPNFFFNNYLIRILNFLYFNTKPRYKARKVFYEKYFYPLDNILNWNNIYGKRGFCQFQLIIPKLDAKNNLKKIFILLKNYKYCSFVTTLKLLGPKNKNYLSFPMEGYTLTFDLQNSKELAKLQLNLENILNELNGKIYLTKDNLMTKEFFHKSYYNEIKKLRKIINNKKNKYKFNSLQSKRLGIL